MLDFPAAHQATGKLSLKFNHTTAMAAGSALANGRCGEHLNLPLPYSFNGMFPI
jgi:hypothetical protein